MLILKMMNLKTFPSDERQKSSFKRKILQNNFKVLALNFKFQTTKFVFYCIEALKTIKKERK